MKFIKQLIISLSDLQRFTSKIKVQPCQAVKNTLRLSFTFCLFALFIANTSFLSAQVVWNGRIEFDLDDFPGASTNLVNPAAPGPVSFEYDALLFTGIDAVSGKRIYEEYDGINIPDGIADLRVTATLVRAPGLGWTQTDGDYETTSTGSFASDYNISGGVCGAGQSRPNDYAYVKYEFEFINGLETCVNASQFATRHTSTNGSSEAYEWTQVSLNGIPYPEAAIANYTNVDYSDVSGSVNFDAAGNWLGCPGTPGACQNADDCGVGIPCSTPLPNNITMSEFLTGSTSGTHAPGGLISTGWWAIDDFNTTIMDGPEQATHNPTPGNGSIDDNQTIGGSASVAGTDGDFALADGDLVTTVTYIFGLTDVAFDTDCDGLTATNTLPAARVTWFDVGCECLCDIVLLSAVATDETCAGDMDGTITINATSSNPIEYSIDGGTTFFPGMTQFTGLADGTYTVVVQDVGDPTCTATIMVTINPGPVIDPPTAANVMIACGDPAPTLTASCDDPDCLCSFDPATMDIAVCFTGVHTFVSDLSFYIQGPAGCATPLLTLAASPGICNGGDDFTDLCFTNNPADGDFDVCTAAVPLNGDYSSVLGTAIDWSFLAGCNIYEGGWEVIIGDCVGGDIGFLNQVVMTISDNGGGTSCLGPGGSVVYDSGAGLGAAINDNECVPGVDMPAAFAINIPPQVNWYNVAMGGAPIGSGAMFPVAGTTALEGPFDNNTEGVYTYYVDCTCQGCTSARVPVTVTVGACCEFTATCPTVTDLGTFNCTNLNTIPACPATAADLALPPYAITIGAMPCGTIEFTCVDDILPAMYDVCTTGGQLVTRTITVYDDLNNNQMLDIGEESEPCTFTFTIEEDVTPPTITCPGPIGPIEGCDETAITVATAGFVYSAIPVTIDAAIFPGSIVVEACFADSATYVDAITATGCTPANPGNPIMTVTRTWTVTDSCGNESLTCMQVITIEDTTAPVISCGAVDCASAPAPLVYIASSDGTGDGTCGLGGEFIEICVVACAGCPGSVDVTGWEVEDDASNDGSPATTINFLGGSLLSGECVTIQSGYLDGTIPGNPVGTMGSVILIGSDRGACPVWNSGGDNIFLYDGDSQTGGVLIDTEPSTGGSSTYTVPVLVCPSPSTSIGPIEGCDETAITVATAGFAYSDIPVTIPAAQFPGTIDLEACGAAIATYVDAITANGCTLANPGNPLMTVTRTWTVTDDCGNVSLPCTQVITIEDTTAPLITCPGAIGPIEGCDETAITVALAGFVYSDIPVTIDATMFPGTIDVEACGVATATYVDAITANGCTLANPGNPLMTVTRTWTVTDNCGNVSSACIQEITIEDTTAPLITCPGPIGPIEGCDETAITVTTAGFAYSDVPVAIDAAMFPGTIDVEACGAATATYVDVITSTGCTPVNPGNPIMLVTRTWTVTDNCGNESLECTQEITIEDTTPPVSLCQNITVELDENGEATITVNDIDNGSFDACSAVTLSIDKSTFTCADLGPAGTPGCANVVPVTLTVTDECGNTDDCVAMVTVEDNLAPVLTCPADMTLTLDPGECGKYLNYQVPFATDNCEIIMTTTFLGTTFIDNNGGAGNMFDVENIGAEAITINSFDVHLSTASGTNHTVGAWYVTGGGSYAGNETNAAAWTLIGDVPVVAAGPGNPSPLPAGGLVIQPGEVYGIHIFQTDGGTDIDYTNGANVYTDPNMQITVGLGRTLPIWTGGIFSPRTWNGNIHYSFGAGSPVTVTQTSGPPLTSGDFFPIGSYTFEWQAEDGCGNISTCDYTFVIDEFPNPINSLNCNLGGIQISLDPNCEAVIGADDILEGGPYGCYDNYPVQLFFDANLTQPVPGSPVVTGANIGQTLWVMVSDPNGNACWGTIFIEDKHVPDLECGNFELPCSLPTIPGTTVPGGVADLSVTDGGQWASTGSFDNAFGVNGLGTVTDVNVALDITHTWVGDLDISITSPSGTTVVVFQGQCGNTDDVNATFDDESTNAFACVGNAPVLSGDMMPMNPLSAFDGEPAFGDWIVNVADNVGGDGGNINSINLTVAYSAATPVPFPVPQPYILGQTPASPNINIWQTTAQQGTQCYTVDDFDGCGLAELCYSDWIQDIDCLNPGQFDPNYTKIIYRTWTVTDLQGNSSTCQDTLNLIRATLGDLVPPADFVGVDALNCEDKEPASGAFCGVVLGWNALDSGPYAGHPSPYDELYPCGNVKWHGTGVPGGVDCGNINYSFADIRINVCQEGTSEGCYKVVRNWSILDWCTGEFETYTQFIKIADDEGPTITDIVDLTISVNAWECLADWYVTEPWIDDNCSDLDGLYTVTSTAGTVTYVPSIGRYLITGLPLGWHDVKVRALDCCGNASEVTMKLHVEDLVPPYVTCETFRNTSLTIDGTSKIWANAFDDGSYDACGPVYFKVIRTDDLRGTEHGSNASQTQTDCDIINGDDNLTRFGNQIYFDDYVKYCCEDIGVTDLTAKLRVFDRNPGPGPVNPNRMRAGGDLYGHFNDCWSNVTVEDKLAPFISCPTDLTVSCDFWFDVTTLDQLDNRTFGTVVEDLADVQYIIVNDRYCSADPNDINGMGNPLFDPNNPTQTFDKNLGQDGLAADNCDVDININVVDNLVCGQGTITRIFTATDPDGRTASCVQRITIVDCDPYYINDTNCFNFDPFDGVRWPCDYNSSTCGQATDPSVAGEPQIFNDDNCALIAVTYDDEDFPVVPDACFKIKRIWTITDWCQYDATDTDANDVFDATDDGVIAGQWEYVQYIKVLNSDIPVFGSCDDIVLCDDNNSDCTANGPLTNTLSDDCTPGDLLIVDFKIDLDNDGTYDYIGSNVTPYPYPNPGNLPILSVTYTDADGDGTYDLSIQDIDYAIGTHRILWTAEDVCSNIGNCEYLFEARDCKKPTPKVFHGLAVDINPGTDEVCVPATYLDAGSYDNCAVQTMRIGPAGGPDQTVPPSTTTICFDCNDLGTQSVDFWVMDVHGNWDYVATYVNVQNNMGACGGSTTASISGTLNSEAGQAAANVDVHLMGNNGMVNQTVSNAQGDYDLSAATGQNYSVQPEKLDDLREGISTLDLVLISRHLIGLQPLDTPYKLIAADVNNDEAISTFDLIDLQKVILFIYDEFPNNNSFRFVDSEFSFPNPANPFQTVIAETVDINGLSVDEIADFVAIKTGDVNGSAQMSATGNAGNRSFNGEFFFNVADASLKPGQTYRVDFTAKDFAEMIGYQFTLAFDQHVVEFVDVVEGDLDGLNAANFGTSLLDRGVLTANWGNVKSTSVEDGRVLFTVTFKATANGKLSEVLNIDRTHYTSAEAYNASLDFLNVNLGFTSEEGTVVASNDFELLQNQPNPFKDATEISFVLPEASEATLSIYDVSGRVLTVIEGDYAKGYNKVTVSQAELGATGVLYYRFDSEEFSGTKKMIIIE